IELERPGNRPCRAGVEAARAVAAAVFRGRVGFQLERREDFRQKNPVACSAADEIRVLADKAESGSLGQIAFEQRAGIDIPERTRVRSADLVDISRQRFEARSHYIVIIVEAGIACDDSGTRNTECGARSALSRNVADSVYRRRLVSPFQLRVQT